MAKENSNRYEDDVEDDLDDDSNYVFFKDRDEWKDVIPVAQDDGPYSAVKINYSPKFQDAYDYLRAVILKGEKSSRVLGLTAQAIEFNAANYTAWQYRRDVLEALGIPHKVSNQHYSSDFDMEMNFSQEVIEDNTKNYQVWHHRKMLVSWAAGYNEQSKKHSLDDAKDAEFLAKKEMDLTRSLLNKDAKNYHAWQHRQWVIAVFGTFEGELQYTAELIDSDVRNNSAWNHRYFVLKHLHETKPQILDSEVEYTAAQILKAVSNESPWSYMRGILELQGSLGKDSKFLEQCKTLIQNESPSIPLRAFLLDAYERKIDEGTCSEEALKHGVEICEKLGTSLDVIRKGYWALKKKSFEIKVQA